MSAELQDTDYEQRDVAELAAGRLLVITGLTKRFAALLSSLLTRETCGLAERMDE